MLNYKKEKLNNTRALFLTLGYILGLLNAGIIMSVVSNFHTPMEKAQAVVGCIDHKGIDRISYTYLQCKDGYKASINNTGSDVYNVYEKINSKTLFNYTYYDWKNERISVGN